MQSNLDTRSLQTMSSISSFSPLPSDASIRFLEKMLAPTPPRRHPDDTDEPPASPTRARLIRAQTLTSSELEIEGSSIETLVPVAPELDQMGEAKMGTKKKRSFAHAVKKASTKAARKLTPKSWGRGHSRPACHIAVQEVFKEAAPETTDEACTDLQAESLSPQSSSSGEVSNASTDSLTAVHGSPESDPEARFRYPATLESALVATTQPQDDPAQQPDPTLARLALHTLLFVPSSALLGALPFVAPAHLSRVAFHPLLHAGPRPGDAAAHHARTLPWHVGLALGLLAVGLRALARVHPACAFALLAALVARTWGAWADFDARAAGHAGGADDRATVWLVLAGLVRGAAAAGESDEVAAQDDGLDIVIHLKDRPHECLRIVVDCPEAA
ncbi:hypothetical protein PsYK624_052340 [Phanerochaete sordida]|uniref:Uncharacterized protein n=1 Tax=Phanerochaete sordida TaxID=48140 RepID=A0A9P3LBF1_9APHY|nr:hypothetical protein PsYK624_052340 [Phanerochaete sordida]